MISTPPLVPPLPAGLVVEDAQGRKLPELRVRGKLSFLLGKFISQPRTSLLVPFCTALLGHIEFVALMEIYQ